MDNNPEFDAEDLVWIVVGVLYSTGHRPIVLNETTMGRAVPAASKLLSAIGLIPIHRHAEPGER